MVKRWIFRWDKSWVGVTLVMDVTLCQLGHASIKTLYTLTITVNNRLRIVIYPGTNEESCSLYNFQTLFIFYLQLFPFSLRWDGRLLWGSIHPPSRTWLTKLCGRRVKICIDLCVAGHLTFNGVHVVSHQGFPFFVLVSWTFSQWIKTGFLCVDVYVSQFSLDTWLRKWETATDIVWYGINGGT